MFQGTIGNQATLRHLEGHLAGTGLPTRPLTARRARVALTPTSDRIIALLSYSAFDWAVNEEEENQILSWLRADADLSATIVAVDADDMLTALLERVDGSENRRDLLRLLGARLNPAARALVEPIIRDLDIKHDRFGAQIQYNLGRLGVSGGAAPFDRAPYGDLISGDATAPFIGSGATGINSSERGYSDWARAGRNMFDDHLRAVRDLSDNSLSYLGLLTYGERRNQVHLLLRQAISTVYEESYAGQLPSRLQIMRAAGAANNIEGELVAAIILAEQRDQSRAEDARDFIGGMIFEKNISIGLGQVLPSTARRNDLFADVLTNHTTTFGARTPRGNLNHHQLVRLLASDETNIFAVARYIRILANAGAALNIATLPNTQRVFPGIDLAAYAKNSAAWPEDNVGALGMCYSSRAWTDVVRDFQRWGRFVQQAYRDVKATAPF